MRLEDSILFFLHEEFLHEQILILFLDLELGLEGGELLHEGLVFQVNFMGHVLDPVQLRGHLLLLLEVLLVFLAFVDLVFLELLLYFIHLLLEEAADVELLLDQDLRRLILDRADVVDDLLVQLADALHPVPIAMIQRRLASELFHPYFIYSCSSSMIFRYWISLSTNLCLITMISSSRPNTLSRDVCSYCASYLDF